MDNDTVTSEAADFHANLSAWHIVSYLQVTTLASNISIEEAVIEGTTNKEALEITRFVVQRVLVPIVVLFGVTGNIASVIVLTDKSMKTSTNCYLTTLAIFDMLYLLTSFVLSLKHYDDLYENEYFLYIYIGARILSDMFSNVSVCLTVTFTIERWIAVCHPMTGRRICTPKRARIIASVVSISAMLCIVPEFFEWRVYQKVSGNKTYFKETTTDFANSDSYAIGYYWFLVVVFTFLPLFALCLFNIVLIRAVYRASMLRRRMTYANVQRPNERHQGDQNRITCMLIGVALVFIFCQFPSAAMIIYHTYLDILDINLTIRDYHNLLIAGNVTNLLLAVNAAVNFVLYSAMSTKFRKLFIRKFCKWMPGRKVHRYMSEYSDLTGLSYMKRASTLRTGYSARNSREDIVPSNSQSSISKKRIRSGSPLISTEEVKKSSESLLDRITPPRPINVSSAYTDTIL